jgi:hypothetical protein
MDEHDLYDGLPEGAREADALAAGGWTKVHHLGGDPGHCVTLRVFRRMRPVRAGSDRMGPEFGLLFSDALSAGPMLVGDSYTEVLDTVARWSPILTGDALGCLYGEAGDVRLGNLGIIEQIGAKLAYGREIVPAELERCEADRAAKKGPGTR